MADRSRESDTIPTRVDVQQESPEFDVEPINATYTAGSGGTFEVTVTNNRDHALTDISAKIYMDSPLSTSDDEAFVERLEPGESQTVRFQVSAGGDATAKTYPVKMDFQYDQPDGDTIISDTYQIPVEVTADADGGGLPVLPIVGVVAVLLVGGGFLYYRRQG
jgi:uncharacterized membrane protein